MDTQNNTNNTQETQNTQSTQSHRGSNIFSFLYRTRIKVDKGSTPILNLSLIFSILAVCTAPWLAVIGLVVALVLGYRFSIQRNSSDFNGDFDEIVKNAASNVKSTVDTVINNDSTRD